MKMIKKCPVFLLLISSGLLFTIIGVGGRSTVYAAQDYDPVKAPVLSVMFAGMNEGIYPWMIFTGASAVKTSADAFMHPDDGNGQDSPAAVKKAATPSPTAAKPSPAATKPTPTPVPSATPTPTPVSDYPSGRLEPSRESTYDEYMNHISADIYGETGVLRAAEYEFSTVAEDYFDDALFIGDSRTVGLYDYTDLSQHGDFYCETSLTIYKVMEENFKGKGTIANALASKDYGKIYLMVGVNELGRGTTEDFMEQYTEVIDTLHELEPDAVIYIQGIMRVSGQKNQNDAIFNNSNINARNNAIATLADNQQIFYIDVNEVVCDEEGNLEAEYTFDQIHLLGVYNDIWKQFLMTHAVTK